MLINARFGDCYINESDVVGIERREYQDNSVDKKIYTASIIFGNMAQMMVEFIHDDDVSRLIESVLKAKANKLAPMELIEQEEKTYIDGFKDGCEYTLKLKQ